MHNSDSYISFEDLPDDHDQGNTPGPLQSFTLQEILEELYDRYPLVAFIGWRPEGRYNQETPMAFKGNYLLLKTLVEAAIDEMAPSYPPTIEGMEEGDNL